MRVHLRTVSCSGHSHAVSMWACPVAITRWALARAGTSSAGCEHRPGGDGRVVATAGRLGEQVERAARCSCGCGPGAGRRRRARASPRRARRGRAGAPRRRCPPARAPPGRACTAAGRRRWRASRAATAGTAAAPGLAAASTTSSTGPGSPRSGTAWRRGWMPCTGRPLPSRTSPSHWKPGVSSRKPRSISASTRRPDHDAGTSPVNRNHVVPHGGPHRAPTANGATSSSDGPASTSSGTRAGWTSGRTRSVSSRLIRSSTSSRSSCMARNGTGGSQSRSARSADRRSFPLSSRSGVSTYSTVRGSL